ncbi:flagellar assembly protein H [Chromobacterium violaceum]|uniref:Flagellar assembly protein FliH n=1 Tax=Chromobacterium violaceum TaxID=536 RepID=A0A3S4HK95_CHRVL|nr:flagellar assembly protein H [Chromobacterium violaceum]
MRPALRRAGRRDSNRACRRAGARRRQALAEQLPKLEEAWQALRDMGGDFSGELARLEQELARDVLQLAWALAQKLLQQKLERDEQALLPLLQAALAELPSTLANARLRVNPADLAVAREFLQQETPETAWQWVEDAQVRRGGCVIDASSVRLDMTLETRLAAMSRALGLEDGDERQPA